MNQDSARAATLRSKLDVRRPAVAMAAHSPLAAKLAAGAGFDAIWGSGFELSASYAVPDASILSMDIHLEMMRAIGEVQDAPVIADIDTGFGNAVNVAYVVPRYVAAGVAAVVIEDKTFPKDSSLRAGGRQELVPIGEFQGKLAAAKATGQRAGHSTHRGVDCWSGSGPGAPTRRGLSGSRRGWRADPQQTEETGRDPGILPSLAGSRASGPGADQLPATVVRGCCGVGQSRPHHLRQPRHSRRLFETYPTRHVVFRQGSTRVYANDTIVVTNAYSTLTLTDKSGNVSVHNLRNSTTWLKMENQWRIVDQHISEVNGADRS